MKCGVVIMAVDGDSTRRPGIVRNPVSRTHIIYLYLAKIRGGGPLLVLAYRAKARVSRQAGKQARSAHRGRPRMIDMLKELCGNPVDITNKGQME